MKVRVRYLTQLKQAAGTGAEEIELPGPCVVEQLLAHLAERHAPLRRLLLSGGRPQPTILVFVGDEQVAPSAALGEGAEVTLLSPVAGGAS
jgi:molybdopterin synthase catalytic subunit